VSGFFEFGDIDAFTAGAIGLPGQRVFLLQARAEGRRVTLKCEKQQVGALGQYLRQLLSDLPAPDDEPIPAALELIGDSEPEFVVGPMGLGYARDLDRLVFTAEELVRTDEEGEADPEALEDRGRLRVHLTRAQASAFIKRVDELLAQSRPLCQFCGLPVDPDGHPCPRMN
jgi:uncharacterized repeat protein (TIGR03847 family)